MDKITHQKVTRSGFFRCGVPALAIMGGGVALGFRNLSRCLETSSDEFRVTPFGEILPGLNGIIGLPEGFLCQTFSRIGEMVDGGLLVLGGHNSMTTFRGD